MLKNVLAPMASQEETNDEVESTLRLPRFAQPFNAQNLNKTLLEMNKLREPDVASNPAVRPISGPEIDDLDPPNQGSSGVGIDDGLLSDVPLDPTFGSRGLIPGGGTRFIPPGFLPGSELRDVNLYQQKKTVAQGMMDIALLSANANQLHYVLESGGSHPYYYASLSLIGISIILQVAVGVGLILNSLYNVSYETSMRKANRINNYTVLAIFLITVLNVFTTAFGTASGNNTVGNFPPSVALRVESSEVGVP